MVCMYHYSSRETADLIVSVAMCVGMVRTVATAASAAAATLCAGRVVNVSVSHRPLYRLRKVLDFISAVVIIVVIVARTDSLHEADEGWITSTRYEESGNTSTLPGTE